MKMIKIFRATFEESLNIYDDPILKYLKDRGNVSTKPRPILTKILIVLGLLLLYGITKLTATSVKGGVIMKDSPLLKPHINFIPLWLFWFFLALWFIIAMVIQLKKYPAIQGILSQFRAWLYLIWLMIFLNLMFVTMFLFSMTILGIVAFFLIILIVEVVIIKAKINSLNKQILNIEVNENKVDDWMKSLISYIVKYGWILIALFMVWKFIFPTSTEVHTDFIGFITIVVMWFIINIAVITALVYFELPLLLLGYYINKYSEEYREWEGQTPEQWYGKNYFKKIRKKEK
ncbi:DUF4176 domain-containing protein [Lactococcus lactis]|nr:DUF4176 domain-containing protein [Lactococcus lactis]